MMSTELLQSCALFKGLTPVGLEIFARIAHSKILLAGKPLFTEGGASDALYVITEGRLQILARGSDGRDTPIASLGPGEHLAEMALLAPSRGPLHLCSALAEVNSKVLEITTADFQSLMKEKPQACTKLLLAIATELGAKIADSRDSLRSLLGRTIGR